MRGWRDAAGAEGGLGPVGGLEFVEDLGDVVLHRLEGQSERPGDLLVAGPAGEQVEDFAFPCGQVVGLGGGGWPAGCAGQ